MPEGIHLMIGRRPVAAFETPPATKQMLEYTGAGDGLRLKMLVLHDDAEREYAYGPAQGLPDTKVGTFTQDLYDEAKKDGWVVISMKKRTGSASSRSRQVPEIGNIGSAPPLWACRATEWNLLIQGAWFPIRDFWDHEPNGDRGEPT